MVEVSLISRNSFLAILSSVWWRQVHKIKNWSELFEITDILVEKWLFYGKWNRTQYRDRSNRKNWHFDLPLSFFNRCGLLKRRFFVPLLTSEVLNTQYVNKTDNYNLFHVIEKNFHCLSWFRDSLSQYVTYYTVTNVHTYLVDITHFIIQ